MADAAAVFFADGPHEGTVYQPARYREVIVISPTRDEPEVRYRDTGTLTDDGALIYREVTHG